MKKEFIVIFIGVLLLFVFVGAYFAFTTAANDPGPAKLETKKAEKLTKKNNTLLPSPVVPIVDKAKTQNNDVILKPMNQQKVVDQTLQSPLVKEEPFKKEIIIKEEKPLPTKDTLGSVKEKIDIEITLYDGFQNKLLTDYEVEFKYQYKNESIKSENFRTDKNGKFIFTTSQPGEILLQILTKDYSINRSGLHVRFGKNEYQAKLFKGGTIEIRATNTDNKIVEDLTIVVGSSKEPFSAPIFDEARGVYVFSNIPLGTQYISLKANGYSESTVYMIRIDAKEIAHLEVKLLPSRILYFDLDINVKPEFINISKYNYYAADNQVQGTENTEVFKNEKNLFALEVNDRGVSPVTIYVDKYIPQKVNIVADKDIYKVSLIEGFTGKLQVNNETGKPIVGAIVTYADSMGKFIWRPGSNLSKGTFRKIAVTDNAGVALLTGLTETVALELSISHKDFAITYDNWSFDSKTQSSKNVTMAGGTDIVGRVSCYDKPIMGAKIFLFETGNLNPLFTLISDAEGKYRLNHFENKKEKEYFIKAFHRDFGAIVTPTIKWEEKTQVIDLKLVKEKSVTIKLTDNKGVALANKNITISHNSDPQSRISILTDEKGEYECFNLIHGDYTICMDDKEYMAKKNYIKIPSDTLLLKAEQKSLKKVIVTTIGGGNYRGALEVKNARTLVPLNLNLGEDGKYYFDFQDDNQIISGPLFFEASGYAIVTTGPYSQIKNLPDELKIEIIEGDNLSIKVMDEHNHQSIPFVMVNISKDVLKDSSTQPMPDIYNKNRKYPFQFKPTNELGEVLFSNLSGKVNVSISVNKYAPFKSEIDLSQTKNLVIKMVKGGSLKGHLTFGKDIIKTLVGIEKGYYFNAVDQDGNFEINNLTPGEYTVYITQTFKNGNVTTKNLPTKIKIENEKILEINLDEALKN